MSWGNERNKYVRLLELQEFSGITNYGASEFQLR